MFNRSLLANYIQEKGYRQSVIAKKAGLTCDQLSKILHGKRKCSVDEFLSICKSIDENPHKFIVSE